ncbi:MAG: hypothetical protein IT580_11855 [Verrucomicrobiales bacterium]|nr:hypothetical protein [Verrucomicrobiales bacterium]
MMAELQPILDRILGGVATGFYQGLLVAVGLALALRILRRSNAATRHAVAFAALLIVMALPVGHALFPAGTRLPSWWDRSWVSNGEEVTTESETTLAAVGTVPQVELGSSLPAMRDQETPTLAAAPIARATEQVAGADDEWGRGFEMGSPVGAEPGAGPAAQLPGESEMASGVEAEGNVEAGQHRASGAGRLGWRVVVPRLVGWGLLGCWLVVAGIRLVRLLLQCAALRRLRRAALPAPTAMEAAFRGVVAESGVRRPVRLAIVSELNSPILVGWRHPVVLMPALLAEGSASDWEPMFIHELAHVRRWDDWSNLIQQGAVALFFFHPAVIWISRRLAVEREIACDDHVLSAKGSPRSYALFLTEHARRMRGPEWVAAPAAWSNPSQLKERIHMLLNTNRNTSPRLARMRAGAWTSTVLVLGALAFHAAPRLSVAGSSPESSPGTGAVELDQVTESYTVEEAPVDISISTDVEVQTDLESAGSDVLEESLPKKKNAVVVQATEGAITIAGPDGDVLQMRPPEPANTLVHPPVPPVPGHLSERHAPHVTLALPAPPPHPMIVEVPTVNPSLKPRVLKRPTRIEGKPGDVLRLAEVSRDLAVESRDELERRLDRLEKMVESLVDQRTGRGVVKEREGKPRATGTADSNLNVDVKIRRSEEQVRMAEKAMADVERRVRETAEKAASMARSATAKEGLRRPLEEHRRALSREIGQLSKQLGHLEAELDRLEDESDRMEEQIEREVEQEIERELEGKGAHSLRSREERRTSSSSAGSSTESIGSAPKLKEPKEPKEVRKQSGPQDEYSTGTSGAEKARTLEPSKP